MFLIRYSGLVSNSECKLPIFELIRPAILFIFCAGLNLRFTFFTVFLLTAVYLTCVLIFRVCITAAVEGNESLHDHLHYISGDGFRYQLPCGGK